MRRRGTIAVLCILVLIPVLFSRCADMTAAQKGAVGGAAVGAIGGAIIGGSTTGALIGAGVGALGGALVNDALNKDKKN